MDNSEKCMNCRNLKFREGYLYPYRCVKNKGIFSKDSEIREHLDNPCTKYEPVFEINNTIICLP